MNINDYNFAGKKAIVRVDFNVPLQDGKITDDTRIRGAVPTLKLILEKGGALIIMSHMGKPKGKVKPELSLGQIKDAVAKALDTTHIHVTSNRSYNNEDALASAIYLAYVHALNEYTIIKEMTAGKGFADVVFIPAFTDKPAMVIELKRNGTTESAIKQIKERQYFEPLKLYKGRLLLVGINYDEKKQKHTCKIEEWNM
jgi:hypothetical protein